MSNDVQDYADPNDQAVALYLLNNDGDALTDALVKALDEAFRILGDEITRDTVH